MRLTPGLDRLYLANATVLLVHQMDAAYWHEWRLFRMPGGLAVYLVLNLPIALVVLAGYGAVAARRPSATAYSWVLAAAGSFAAAFHAAYLLGGDPAFRAPVSLALLVDTALLSLAQAVLLVRQRRRPADVPALAP
jgi:4-amino-4-deoxy-L-arabinose transferase-like glycosyltransferase